MLRVRREDQLGWHKIRLVESTYDEYLGANLEHLVEEKTFATKRGAARWITTMVASYAVINGLVEL